MSTHAMIGKLNDDNTVTAVYLHFDGYTAYAGKILLENYNTPDAVDALLANGDMSALENNTDECVYYHRDRDEDWDDVQPSHYSNVTKLLNTRIEYIYLFSNGAWSYTKGGDNFSPLTLEDCVERF